MARVVIAVYDSQYTAKKAVHELSEFGFEHDFIQIVKQSRTKISPDGHPELKPGRIRSEIITDEVQSGGQIGAGIGAAIGLACGLLISAGVLHFPGFFIDGISSILIALMGGTAAGALPGMIFGGLLGGSIGIGFPETEAEQYARVVCPSNVQVRVFTDRSTVDQALEILSSLNPLQIQEVNSASIKQGLAGQRQNAKPAHVEPEQHGHRR